MEAQQVIYERTFEAPVANVWRAITEPELIKQWSFDIPDFKPEVGHEFSFTTTQCDEGTVHLCKVTIVDIGTRLAFTWRYKGYEGDSLVTYDLIPEGNSTIVRLTHAGLETFPANLLAKKDISGGWTYLIGTALKSFFEKSAQTSIM
jgi:uncharacterized protein YndB with AHSA1/START domain